MFAGMSEDDGSSQFNCGQGSPSTPGETESKFVCIRGGKYSPAKKSEPAMSSTQQIQRYYSREKVEFLQAFIKDYMSKKQLSPQQMYDRIMEPEIAENISKAWTETGIRLSRVKARPHQGNEGRDIIRNWIQRYPFSVHEGFLPKADRFLREVKGTISPSQEWKQTQLERKAKLAALRELLGDGQSSGLQEGGLRTDHTYCLALIDLSNEDRVLGCITFHFDDDTTGSFHMFRFDRHLYEGTSENNLKDGNCKSLQFNDEQISLFASGLCSIRRGHIFRDGKYGEIDVDALYADVIETSCVGGSEFWFDKKGMNSILGRFHFRYKLKRKIDPKAGRGRDEIFVYAGVFYRDLKDRYGDRLRLIDFPISDKQLRLLEERSGYLDYSS